MNNEALKMECLRVTGGVLHEAKDAYAWATNDSNKPHEKSIAALERAAEVCEINAPIHAAEGNAEQAAASKANGEGYRAAAAYLQTLMG